MKVLLEGKVAIISGASRGIGRAIAHRLAAAGAAVVVNHRASAEQAAATVAAIERAGGRALAVEGDVGSVAEVRRLVETTVERFGRLDILVNNAGVGKRTAMADMTEQEFDWTMSVNARGPMFAIQAAVPRMGSGGRIISWRGAI
jgi:3-oxoacyl-[acyl-carrier protein] reductase